MTVRTVPATIGVLFLVAFLLIVFFLVLVVFLLVFVVFAVLRRLVVAVVRRGGSWKPNTVTLVVSNVANVRFRIQSLNFVHVRKKSGRQVDERTRSLYLVLQGLVELRRE